MISDRDVIEINQTGNFFILRSMMDSLAASMQRTCGISVLYIYKAVAEELLRAAGVLPNQGNTHRSLPS